MKIRGVRLRLHPLLGLIIMASVLTGYFIELLTLFVIVAIHELGHAAAAAQLGWKVKEIQLLPFGGVAIVEQQGVVPAGEELWVALAGPLQNIWMIGVAWTFNHFGLWSEAWGHYFLSANLMICLFNLIPVLPLDGGKVLQALLSMTLPYYKSLQISLWISLGMGSFIALFALLSSQGVGIQLNLLIIGLFLIYSNWISLRHLPYHYMRFLMYRPEKVDVLRKKGVAAEPILVLANRPVQEMLRMLKRDCHHLYYLMEPNGRTRGVVPESSLVARFFTRNAPNRADFRDIM